MISFEIPGTPKFRGHYTYYFRSPHIARFVLNHLAQGGVDAGLVASAAFGFEPVEDIGIEAEGDLLFDRAVEFAACGAGPIEFLRDVGEVDAVVGQGGEARGFGQQFGGEFRGMELVHNASFRRLWRGGR